MYALAVQNIPEGKEWLYEVKFDGYRCLSWMKAAQLEAKKKKRIAKHKPRNKSK